MDTVNLHRIEQLIKGDQPVGIHEELFVVAFKEGLSGTSFMLTLMQVSDIFAGMTHEDKNYFCLGYALGQKTFQETEELIINEITVNTNQTKH